MNNLLIIACFFINIVSCNNAKMKMSNSKPKFYKDIDIFSLVGQEPISDAYIEYPYVSILDADSVMLLNFYFSSKSQVSKRLEKKSNGYIEKINKLDDDGTEITDITAYQNGSLVRYTMMPDESQTPIITKAIRIIFTETDSITEYIISGGIEIKDFFMSKTELESLINLNKENVNMIAETKIINQGNEYWRINVKTTHLDFPDVSSNCYLYKTHARNWYWTTFHFEVPDSCN